VGIGTTTPYSVTNYKSVTVNGTGGGIFATQVNGTNAFNISTGSASTYIVETRALPIQIGTNNTEKVRILSNGNVGIGTIAPVSLLEINGANAALTLNNAVASTTNLGIASFNGSYSTDANAGDFIIRANSKRILLNTDGASAALIMHTTKNITVGSNTDAGYKLDVNGTARVKEYLYLLRSDAATTIAALTYQAGNTIDIGNTFRVLGTNRWQNTVGSASYIENNYFTKVFASVPQTNGSWTMYDFQLFGSMAPTVASSYNQKVIGTAFTIQSTAVNSFFGVDVRATDNSSSIANNVYAIYADATLGTNTSSNRWAGYFVGRISNTLGATFATSSGNVLIGTTTDGGQRFQVNGTTRLTGDVTIVTTTSARQITFENSTLRAGVNISQPNNTLTFNNGAGFELNSQNVTLFTSANTYFKGFQGSATFSYVNTSNVSCWSTLPDASTPYAWGRKLCLTGDTTITVPNASAVLDIQSTTMGFLPPRMTGAQAELIGTPAAGLMVYANNGNGVTITSIGWWGYNGTTWVKLN
jgi:hypothetical protein